jgi:heme/copper-type cytochrome/quinol oxidase subunit 2
VSFLLVIFYAVLANVTVADMYYIKDMIARNQPLSLLQISVSIILLVILFISVWKALALYDLLIKLAEKKVSDND